MCVNCFGPFPHEANRGPAGSSAPGLGRGSAAADIREVLGENVRALRRQRL